MSSPGRERRAHHLARDRLQSQSRWARASPRSERHRLQSSPCGTGGKHTSATMACSIAFTVHSRALQEEDLMNEFIFLTCPHLKTLHRFSIESGSRCTCVCVCVCAAHRNAPTHLCFCVFQTRTTPSSAVVAHIHPDGWTERDRAEPVACPTAATLIVGNCLQSGIHKLHVK